MSIDRDLSRSDHYQGPFPVPLRRRSRRIHPAARYSRVSDPSLCVRSAELCRAT